MSTVEEKSLLTAEDLAAMPDEKSYELIDGELVERKMGLLSSWVGGQLYLRLGHFVATHGSGWVLPADSGFQCVPDSPRTVLKADVSFIRTGRFANEQLPSGYSKLAPNLAVEVISPHDLAYEIDEKIDLYLRAGVTLVWVVNPQTRTVRVHRADGSITQLREGEELSGEDIIPGFRCPLSALFPPILSQAVYPT